jgi:hypothetical protein
MEKINKKPSAPGAGTEEKISQEVRCLFTFRNATVTFREQI